MKIFITPHTASKRCFLSHDNNVYCSVKDLISLENVCSALSYKYCYARLTLLMLNIVFQNFVEYISLYIFRSLATGHIQYLSNIYIMKSMSST